MKNFSEAWDIKIRLPVKITIDSIDQNGSPTAEVIVNDRQLFVGTLLSLTTLSTEISLLDPIKISISMQDKIYNVEKETAVLIQSLTIDQNEIVPIYTHLANYVNDHNNNDPTSYLGFNGTWTLDINKPFYQWLHQVSGQGWLLTP